MFRLSFCSVHQMFYFRSRFLPKPKWNKILKIKKLHSRNHKICMTFFQINNFLVDSLFLSTPIAWHAPRHFIFFSSKLYIKASACSLLIVSFCFKFTSWCCANLFEAFIDTANDFFVRKLERKEFLREFLERQKFKKLS